ncbi:MAG: Gfo/Idh/MocA family oxidoreductase [Planctomycetaceae bacterium]|jgi:predicted dehydrogenase|nr:Gfo/Idh/MocA family oxidoreductase [Planctomycetaceae bacterium]
MTSKQKKQKFSSRRDFLKMTSVGGLGIFAVSPLSIVRGANVSGSDEIKIALIGCGGRGLGAVKDRFTVGDNVKLVAIADVAEETAKKAAKVLCTHESYKDNVNLPDDRIFFGFDAYKKAIEYCDQVLIVSPPAFHPDHYAYAVEQSKHVFIEKPLCIDAEGFKRCMKTNQLAEDRKLTVCVGFQRRYNRHMIEWVQKIHEGYIGNVLNTRVYWNGGQAKVRGYRYENEPEMSFQVRDWYFFDWLSGDHIVEQHCHNIDVGLWIHGKGDRMAHPVSCAGMGGRQVRKTPIVPYNECGNIFDHHCVEYHFADDSVMHSQCRQINRCLSVGGEKVQATGGVGQSTWLKTWDAPRWNPAKNKNEKNSYVQEHIDQVEAIRKGTALHDGWTAAHSSMTAVMGRMATYSGQEIKWDEAVAKGKTLFLYDKELSFDLTPPVMPGPDGTYEHAVALPGNYNPFKE